MMIINRGVRLIMTLDYYTIYIERYINKRSNTFDNLMTPCKFRLVHPDKIVNSILLPLQTYTRIRYKNCPSIDLWAPHPTWRISGGNQSNPIHSTYSTTVQCYIHLWWLLLGWRPGWGLNSLLAPQSGALRISAYRDFHPNPIQPIQIHL